MATGIFVRKDQAISIHRIWWLFIVVPKFHTKISYLLQITWETKLTLQKMTQLLKGYMTTILKQYQMNTLFGHILSHTA